MKKKIKEKFIFAYAVLDEFIPALFVGLVCALAFFVWMGLTFGLIGGFILGFSYILIIYIVWDSIDGLVIGLTCGMAITFCSQLFAFFTNKPTFALFDLAVSGVLLVIIVGFLFLNQKLLQCLRRLIS